MSQYIPDIIERFPEGFGGVDKTASYFYEPNDWRMYSEVEECQDVYGEDFKEEPKCFEIGSEYRQVGFYGGVTIYRVEEIEREKNRILLAEVWFDVDGSGTRPAKWHNLEVDEKGNERALEWTSKEYGNIWIYA